MNGLRLLSALTGAMLLSLAGLAAAEPTASSPAKVAATQQPDLVVKSATQQLQDTIKKRHAEFKADQKLFYKTVNELVVPHFDTRYIAQLVLAKHWRTASDEQKKRFEMGFKDTLIRSYADALLEYHDSVKSEWQPLRMAPDAKDVTVQSKLLRESGPPLPIGFAMRKTDSGEWKIYDIVIENLSLVTNFRGQFASEIKRNGLDALIAKMESGQKLQTPDASASAPSS